MKTVFAVMMGLFCLVSLSALEKTADISKIEPQLIINNVNPFQEKLQAVFELLKQRKMLPENFADNDAVKDKIIEAILKSVSKNLSYCPAGRKDAATIACEAGAIAKIYPPVMLRNGKISYFRLDSMNDAAVNSLIADFGKIPPEVNGIMLDIRQCKGYNRNNSDRIVKVFLNRKKEKHAADSGNLPRCAVLTSMNTSGSAEIIAWFAGKTTNTLSMGEPTAGNPFQPEIVKLSDGSSLLVPLIPPDLQNIPLAPVSPMLEASAATSTSATEDPCVMKVADMLISLKTFNNKKK